MSLVALEAAHIKWHQAGGPDQVTCDMPVQVVWEDVDEAMTLPKFRPVSHDPTS